MDYRDTPEHKRAVLSLKEAIARLEWLRNLDADAVRREGWTHSQWCLEISQCKHTIINHRTVKS